MTDLRPLVFPHFYRSSRDLSFSLFSYAWVLCSHGRRHLTNTFYLDYCRSYFWSHYPPWRPIIDQIICFIEDPSIHYLSQLILAGELVFISNSHWSRATCPGTPWTGCLCIIGCFLYTFTYYNESMLDKQGDSLIYLHPHLSLNIFLLCIILTKLECLLMKNLIIL